MAGIVLNGRRSCKSPPVCVCGHGDIGLLLQQIHGRSVWGCGNPVDLSVGQSVVPDFGALLSRGNRRGTTMLSDVVRAAGQPCSARFASAERRPARPLRPAIAGAVVGRPLLAGGYSASRLRLPEKRQQPRFAAQRAGALKDAGRPRLGGLLPAQLVCRSRGLPLDRRPLARSGLAEQQGVASVCTHRRSDQDRPSARSRLLQGRPNPAR